jgi:hypothetical protein
MRSYAARKTARHPTVLEVEPATPHTLEGNGTSPPVLAAGVEKLRVGELSPGAARALRGHARDVTSGTQRQHLELARENPIATVELPGWRQ